MMDSQDDHQRNPRFRAPQFQGGLARQQEGNRAERAPDADEIFPKALGRAAAPPAVVVVRRTRKVDLSPAAVDVGPPAAGESRGSRVFVVDRGRVASPAHEATEAASGTDGTSVDRAGGSEAQGAAAGVSGASGFRKRTPEHKRAGAVTVILPDAGPEPEPGRDAACEPGLAELERELDRVGATLDRLQASPAFDIVVNDGWKAVDRALDELKAVAKAGRNPFGR